MAIERKAPNDLVSADLQPRGPVHPSPADWRDQVLYFLLPDRFSDAGEAGRPVFDRADPAQFAAPNKAAWMAAGKTFQGGTLKGIASKLDYLHDLGITAGMAAAPRPGYLSWLRNPELSGCRPALRHAQRPA